MPSETLDRVKHVMFSDHTMRVEYLKRLSEALQKGEDCEFTGSDVLPGSERALTLLALLVEQAEAGQLDPRSERMLEMVASGGLPKSPPLPQ